MSETLDGAKALRWISQFQRLFAENADALGNLDRLAGDGDFGDNITSALKKAQAFVEADKPVTFREAFTSLAKGFLDTGGTSGPLFGTLFRAIAKSAEGEAGSKVDVASGVRSGLEVIQQRGGASVGDNTMIDALAPAAEALSVATTLPLVEALSVATRAAVEGAKSTKDLVAKRGRASYVGELSRGVIDPGAVTVALFFAAGAEALGGTTTDFSWLAS